jgi:phosphate-selective porin OprO/OprP
MKPKHGLLCAALLAALSASAHAEIAIDVIGGYEVSLEGLMQADGNVFHNDLADLNAPSSRNNGENSEFDMRRAEVILKGKGTTFDWVVGYDGKLNKWLDTNVKWKNVVGTSYLVAGQYKQPNSLEELSSTRYNDFVSKAMVTNLYGIARRLGVAYGDDRPNWGYQLSYFGRELTRNMNQGQGWGARGYYAPILETGHVLHLGLSAVDYDTDHFDMARPRVRPDADLAQTRLVDTGALRDADRRRTYGLEGLYVQGPFKMQSEYMQQRITRFTHSDFCGDSWYVSGVWNVTGETWGYKNGLPQQSLPNEPETGMWQLGVRYDKTDLNDAGVFGGEEDNITVGVNWYWRSNFKVALNYVDVNSSKFSTVLHRNVDDNPNIVEARFQFYW